MATTKFNTNIINAARSLKDRRTNPSAAGDTGMRYTSALLAYYQNKAVRAFIAEQLAALGVTAFCEKFPELVKTSDVLTVASGKVAKPSDALWVLSVAKSDYTLWYDRVEENDVVSVQTGRNAMVVPSASRPVFWDQAGYVNTLGLTSGNIVCRYIVSPNDLAVITTAHDDGKKNTANGGYTAATNLLQATMNVSFASGDENRIVMFWDNHASKVYFGTVASVKDADEVYLTGEGLPAANISAGDVTMVLMEQVRDTDILLNDMWMGEIVRRMVQYGIADAQAGIVQGND